jgi:adenylate cyclase
VRHGQTSFGHAGRVSEDRSVPDPDELERLGLYDPSQADAPDRLELIHYVMGLGAAFEEVAASSDLEELAMDLNLRPRGPSTLGEVAKSLAIDLESAQRLCRALGLAADPDQPMTIDEAATIRLLAVEGQQLIGEEATMQLARVAGSAMARVAETLLGGFRLNVQLPRRDVGVRPIDFIREYSELVETLLPVFVRSLDALLRRQMVAVAERVWSTDDERSAVTLQRTVGFVDLVGYTETSASLTVRQLTAVLIDFDERSADAVARGEGQIVKTIGDEAMFVTEDAADACRIGLDLVRAFGRGRDPLPRVRVGLATGRMVSVFGDLYGPDVNLASRLVGAADPGSVVVSKQTRDSVSGFTFDVVPGLILKGFPNPTTAYRLHEDDEMHHTGTRRT